jgi:hypothetical protein
MSAVETSNLLAGLYLKKKKVKLTMSTHQAMKVYRDTEVEFCAVLSSELEEGEC